MAGDTQLEEIERRQTLLFDAFSHNGVLGERFLGKAIDTEKAIGDVFVKTYYGHRVLTDAFLDFFGETLIEQIELNNKIGWPKEAKNREKIIGPKSDLKPETRKLLEKLDRMFNVEAHRGLFSLFRESHKVMVEHKLDVSLVPTPDPLRDAMFVNRATETNWMIHRLIPYMRRKETPKRDEWSKKWQLLEDHFRWMVESLSAIGKDIAPAFIEMIDSKFQLDANTYYSEPKVVEPKEKV